MRRFLTATFCCCQLAFLPIGISSGMWAEPELRDTIRSISEWPWLWGCYLLFALSVFALWLIWMNRPWPEDFVLQKNLQDLKQSIAKAEQDGGGNSAALRASP